MEEKQYSHPIEYLKEILSEEDNKKKELKNNFGLYCETCNSLIYEFNLPISLAKLVEERKKEMEHFRHRVKIIQLNK